MNIITDYFEESVELKTGGLNTIVIENRELFINFIKEFINTINTSDGKIIFSDNCEQLNIAKICELIFDPFSLDPNSTRNLKKIYQMLIEKTSKDELYEKRLEFENRLGSFMENVIFESDYDLIYDMVDYQNIFKAVNLRIDIQANNLISNIIDYIDICYKIVGIRVFVFLNLDIYLKDKELIELSNYLCYNNIIVLCLQTQIKRNVLENENLRIIDEDLCEI